MNIIQPPRLTFWRLIFAWTAALAFLSAYQILGSGTKLGVDFSASPSWMGLIAIIGLTGLLSLLFFAATWSRYHERILFVAEFPERVTNSSWMGMLLVSAALI